MDLKDCTMSRLAVPEVGQRDPEKIVEAMSIGVVAVIISGLTVEPKVPFP